MTNEYETPQASQYGNARGLEPDLQPAQVLGPSDRPFEPDRQAMGAHMAATIKRYLPEALEYQRFGYNMLFPKAADIDGVQWQLRSLLAEKSRPPLQQMLQSLQQPTEAFLDKFKLFRNDKGLHAPSLDFVRLKLSANEAGWDERTQEYEIMAQANRLVGDLSEALQLIQALNAHPEYASSWQAFQAGVTTEQRDTLLPVNTDRHTGNYANEKARGNLNGTHPENIKLNRIVESRTWKERLTRQAFSDHLAGQVKKLMLNVNLTGKAAKQAHKQPELAGLAGNLQDVCDVLPRVLNDINALGQSMRPSTPLDTEFALPELGLLDTLGALPSNATSALEATKKAIKDKGHGAKDILTRMYDTSAKNAYRAARHLPHRLGDEPAEITRQTHAALFHVGIILLDKVQQTESALGKVRQAARPLQQAVQWARDLAEMAPGGGTHPPLDNALQLEHDHWGNTAKEAASQLKDTLEALTPLNDEIGEKVFLSQLNVYLSQIPKTSSAAIPTFDTFAETLAGIERHMNLEVVRISMRGRDGRQELDQCMTRWSEQLNQLKAQVKASIAQATGQSMDNFSRDGMLARRIAEWSQVEKKRYLAELPEAHRAIAETQYDRLFLEMIEDYLPVLSQGTDKKDDALLQRLRIEIGNAPQGLTLYPADMASIVAGMKSLDQGIRDWSRRRLVRKILLAACLQPVSLGLNLARLPIKFAITGAQVGWAVHKGRQGIRAGDSHQRDLEKEYALRSFKKTALQLVLSLPPGLDVLIGLSGIALDVYYEGPLEGAAKQIAKTLLTEALWMPLSVGTRMTASAVHESAQAKATETRESAQIEPIVEQMIENALQEQRGVLDNDSASTPAQRLSTQAQLARMAESQDPMLASLALHLKKQLDGEEVPLWQSSLAGPSHYSPFDHSIMLSADASDWTMMHEIAHSLTARQLAYGLSAPDSRLGKLALEIDALRQRAQAAYTGDNSHIEYYLGSIEEFVAGLYSGNQHFIDYLSGMDPEIRGLLSSVIRWIAELLGLAPEQESALTKAMRLSDEVMDRSTISIEEVSAFNGLYEEHDKLFSAPLSHSAPGWRKVGKINNSNKSVPAGKSVKLSFVKKDKSEFQIVIEIPLGHRGASDWQAYVADYVSRFKAWPERLRAGEVKANGQIIPVGSSSRNEILVEDSSAVESVSWYFTDDQAAAPVSARLPGSDISFPVLDDFNRRLHRYGQSLDRRDVLKKNLAAKKEELKKTKTSSWWENDLIDTLQEDIDEVWEKIKELNISIPADKAALDALDRQATAERIVVGMMSLRVESVKPLGYAELDEYNRAASTHALRLKQWETLSNYKEQFHADAAVPYRFQMLTAEENKLVHSMDENQRVLDSTKELARVQQRQWTAAETKKIRLERDKKEYKDLLGLYTRLNKVNTKIKNAALRAQWVAHASTDENRLPKVFTGTNSPVGLIGERNNIEEEIEKLRAIPAPVEGNNDMPEQQASETSPAAINVEPAFTMTKAELDAMEKKGIADLDQWCIAAAKTAGLTITKKDLDTPIRFFTKSQTTGVPNRGQPSILARPRTLRQILLGEADRLAENGLLISTSLHDFGGARKPIIDFLESRVNRSNVADSVMANITASIKSGFDQIHVQKGFEETAKASAALTLRRNFAQLKKENPVYLSIVQNFFLGHSPPSAVYVKGKIVPGLIAIGGGDFRIVISLEKKTFKVFNALSVNLEVAKFIKEHIAPVERPNIKEDDLHQITDSVINTFDTQPSRVEFKTTGSLYRDLLNASADKMLSNIGSLILTRDEASARTGQNMMKDIALLATLGAALVTAGASLAVQIAVSAAVGIGASLTEIYTDNKIATTADRAEDRTKALDDVQAGRIFLAVSVLTEFAGLIKAARGFDQISDALKRVEATGKKQVAGNLATRSGSSTPGSSHTSGYGSGMGSVSDMTVSPQGTPVRRSSPPDMLQIPERPASTTSTHGSTPSGTSPDSGFSTPTKSLSLPRRGELRTLITKAQKEAVGMLSRAGTVALENKDATQKLGRALAGWSPTNPETLRQQWFHFYTKALPTHRNKLSNIRPRQLDYQLSLDGRGSVVKGPSASPTKLQVSDQGIIDLKGRGEPAVSNANLARDLIGSVVEPAPNQLISRQVQLDNQVKILSDGSLDLTEMAIQSLARPRANGGAYLEADSVMAQILSGEPELLSEFLQRYDIWKSQFDHLGYTLPRWRRRIDKMKNKNPNLANLSDSDIDPMAHELAISELSGTVEALQGRLIYGGPREAWRRTESGIEQALSNSSRAPHLGAGVPSSRDAVFDLQMESGLISPARHGMLRALPEGASVAEVLGAQAKTVRSLQDLKNMTPGYALVLVGEDGQVAHTLINKGQGHVAGLNMEGLGSSQSGFASIDLGGAPFTPKGQWVINGKRYTMQAQAHTPEFRLEPIKPTAALTGPISLEDMKIHLANFINTSATKAMLANPQGTCKKIMTELQIYLKGQGFTDFSYRGMYIHSRAADRNTPANHFVLLARPPAGSTGRAAELYAFDLTSTQFREIKSPLVVTENNWRIKFAEDMATTKKVVKYQDFASADSAINHYGPMDYHPAETFREGEYVLEIHDWYEEAKKPKKRVDPSTS